MSNELITSENILSGIACGDSLGKMTSKYSGEQVTQIYGKKITDLGRPIIPRSKRHWEKGDITDDTLLTLLVADSLIAKRRFDRKDIGQRLIDIEDPKGGRQIYKLKASLDPKFVAIDGDTNGPAIRIAGISIVYYDDPLLYKYLIESSTLTHAGRESILCCLLIGHIYAEIMGGSKKDEILKNLQINLHKIMRDYIPELKNSRLFNNLGIALNISGKYERNELCDLLESNIGMTEYPCSSIVSATILGLNYNNPRACLIDIVNRLHEGGDLDTTAAIAGGICCGLNGADNILDWKRIIEERNRLSFKDYSTKLMEVRNGRRYCV